MLPRRLGLLAAGAAVVMVALAERGGLHLLPALPGRPPPSAWRYLLARRGLTDLEAGSWLDRQHASVGDVLTVTYTLRSTARLPKPWLEVHRPSTLPAAHPGSGHLAGRRGRRGPGPPACPCPSAVSSGSTPWSSAAAIPWDSSSRWLRWAPVSPCSSIRVVAPLPAWDLPPADDRGRRGAGRAGSAPDAGRHQRAAVHAGRRLQPHPLAFQRPPPGAAGQGVRHRAIGRPRALPRPGAGLHIGAGTGATIETAVRVAAALAGHALADGRGVGMEAIGLRRTVLPADRGRRQQQKILGLLAVAQAEGDDAARGDAHAQREPTATGHDRAGRHAIARPRLGPPAGRLPERRRRRPSPASSIRSRMSPAAAWVSRTSLPGSSDGSPRATAPGPPARARRARHPGLRHPARPAPRRAARVGAAERRRGRAREGAHLRCHRLLRRPAAGWSSLLLLLGMLIVVGAALADSRALAMYGGSGGDGLVLLMLLGGLVGFLLARSSQSVVLAAHADRRGGGCAPAPVDGRGAARSRRTLDRPRPVPPPGRASDGLAVTDRARSPWLPRRRRCPLRPRWRSSCSAPSAGRRRSSAPSRSSAPNAPARPSWRPACCSSSTRPCPPASAASRAAARAPRDWPPTAPWRCCC